MDSRENLPFETNEPSREALRHACDFIIAHIMPRIIEEENTAGQNVGETGTGAKQP